MSTGYHETTGVSLGSRHRYVFPKFLALYSWVFLFSAFVNILLLTGPLFMIQVYDRVLGVKSVETLLALFVLMTILFFVFGVLDYARARLLSRIGARLQKMLETSAFTHEMRARRFGQIDGSPLVSDVGVVQKFFSSTTILAVFDLPWSPLFFLVIFSLHSLLGWFSLVSAGGLVAIALLSNRFTKSGQLVSQKLVQAANEFYSQVGNAASFLHAQGALDAMRHRWLILRHHALQAIITANDVSVAFSSATKALRLFMQSSMLALGAWLSIKGELAASTMIVGSILLGRALAPIEQLVSQWPAIHQFIRSWNNLRKSIETPANPGKLTQLPRPRAHLEVRNLAVFSSDRSRRLVTNISFHLDPGQVLGVIGESGAGKTTLAQALAGIASIDYGDILLGDASYRQYGRNDLGRLIGYLPQDVVLFEGTIAENIAQMAITFDDGKVVAAAQRANAHELILSLPQGYSTPLALAKTRLSGGETQRIALARAFFGEPCLLVLDEPNSALDTAGTIALNRSIRDFRLMGKTVVIMTHRPSAVSECSKLLILGNGSVRAFGERDEVLANYLQNSKQVNGMIRTVGL